MRIKTTLCGLLLVAVSMWAQPVSQVDALSKAVSFFERSPFATNSNSTSSAQLLELAYAGGGSSPAYYVYNVKNGGGYIVVAGDERMSDPTPIYSLTGRYDHADLPKEFAAIMDAYAEKVQQVRSENTTLATNKANQKRRATARVTTVEPLLGDIAWNQFEPYNGLIPNGYPTGCGATAASMVMKYHAHPASGTGSKEGINFGQQTYNWDLMLPVYNNQATAEQNAEVAKIMRHIGVATDMKYSADGSGTDTRSIDIAMRQYFKYDQNTAHAYRISYTDNEWINMLKREIDFKRPVLYSGSRASGGGHVFVCDGYDSDNRLHFNFGWGGYSNAYVNLNNLDFLVDNAAMLGIAPAGEITEDNQPAPQVVMVAPLTSNMYSPTLGTSFNLGVRLASFNTMNFTGNLGIGLYKTDGTMVGASPLTTKNVTLPASMPASSVSKETDVEINDVKIPVGTPDGDYKLRLLTQKGSTWYGALAVISNVTPDIDVKITDGVAYLSYATKEGNILELVKPIEVNVANNRATIRFSVTNADEFYKSGEADIFVMVTPNNSAIPTISKQVTMNSLASGLVEDFNISDIPLPSGATSCRIYVGYNRVKAKGVKYFTAAPMGSFAYNFKSYTIPQESLIKKVIFTGNDNLIPSTYKIYTADGEPSVDAWRKTFYSNACIFEKEARLVTEPISITDENTVLEWQMSNMYSENDNEYMLYVSTNGQDFENFITPVYRSMYPNNGIARLYLGNYVGKDVYLGFSTNKEGFYGLMYYSLLSVKTPKDISLEKVLLQGTAKSGDVLPVSFIVKNNSAAEITKVIASYTIGTNVEKQEFTTNIPFNASQELTFDKPITAVGAAGAITQVKIRVDMVGEDQTLLANNETNVPYTIANFFPKKGILYYKTTKIGCGGCMLSFTAIDEYEHAFPESTSGVELWRDGVFHLPGFESYNDAGTTPRYFSNGKIYARWEDLINEGSDNVRDMNPPADVWAEASFENEESREMKIQVKADFAMPATGVFSLAAIVIENNVIDTQGQITGQDFSERDKVVKNHIPIGLFGGPKGDMIITNPAAQEYQFEKTFVIPAEESFRYRKNNVQVIVVLYNAKGEILNSSLDSYYLKLPKTEGLTFNAAKGYAAPTEMYEVVKKSSSSPGFTSTTLQRATIARNGTYKFTIAKDATWFGNMPKLYVNRKARYNRGKEEILEPDAKGVYTITGADRHYFIEIEKVEAPVSSEPFTLTHEGEELMDGDAIEITEYSNVNNDLIMKANFYVTKNADTFSSMRMKREEVSVVPNSVNSMCFDDCQEPSSNVANCLSIGLGETKNPYGELILNYDGPATNGTSIIKYTFETSNLDVDPKTITVRYVYKDEPTSIDPDAKEVAFKVLTPASGVMDIRSTTTQWVHIFSADGRLIKSVQAMPGSTIVEGLPKGVYLVNKVKVVL